MRKHLDKSYLPSWWPRGVPNTHLTLEITVWCGLFGQSWATLMTTERKWRSSLGEPCKMAKWIKVVSCWCHGWCALVLFLFPHCLPPPLLSLTQLQPDWQLIFYCAGLNALQERCSLEINKVLASIQNVSFAVYASFLHYFLPSSTVYSLIKAVSSLATSYGNWFNFLLFFFFYI